jgi:putative hydrolase of the HAD superfamily
VGSAKEYALLLDWGDTVMKVFPEQPGPMCEWPVVEATEGVKAALEQLHPTFTIALATNAQDSEEADVRRALARCGIAPWFDHIFCFRRVGHRKPEPAFYRTVLAELGLEPSRVFMVGDSFDGDVRAANALGIRAVWFAPEDPGRPAGARFRTIRRFNELVAALHDLGAPLAASSVPST